MTPWGGNRPTLRDPFTAGSKERTENVDTALRWAWEYVRRLKQAKHDAEWGIKPAKLLGDAAEEYKQHRYRTMSWNTWRNDCAALSHLLRHFGVQASLPLPQAELQAWFNASKLHPNTLALYRSLINSFFEWAGYTSSAVVTPVSHDADPDTLRDDEIATLQAACSSDLERKLVNVGLATGGRKAELWGLHWEDFKPDMQSVRFQRQLGWPGTVYKTLKGKRSRTALVLPGFMDGIARGTGSVLGLRPSQDEATIMFRDLLQKAGLYQRKRGMHILRHTYGRLGMERYKWSTEMLRIFLGHQSVSSVEVYAHFGEEAAIELAKRSTYQGAGGAT